MKYLLAFLLILGSGYLVYNRFFKVENKGELVQMKIGKDKLWVELRDTPLTRRQGLSGREFLADDEGMLFVFESLGNYGFWMNEMKFDLDFVFIRDDKVVEIKEKIPAPKDGQRPVSIKPEELVEMVLEVKSGWVEENGIEVEDKVSFL